MDAEENRTEEGEREERPGAAQRGSERVREETETDLAAVQEGDSVEMLGEQVPKRSLAALGIFVGAYAATLLVLWLLLGGIGLAIGVVAGAAAGFFAVRYTVGSEGQAP